jgi:beta-barrel assembly-enhancing protease
LSASPEKIIMRGIARLPLRLFTLFLVSLWCAACASRLPPLNASGQSFTPVTDEALLWEQAAREHRKLSSSLGIFRDPILEDYLTDLVHRLLPPGTREAGVFPSVHVLINPSLNAFAYPTGAIYVHSGLVARLENEAQLATVLAHELSHIVQRHTVRHLRQERSKDLWKRIAVVTTPLVLGPLLAPVGITVSGTNPAVLLQRPSVEHLLADQALDSSLELATRRTANSRFDQTTTLFTRTQPRFALLASVQGYQPSLIEEADRFAVEALSRAGYDPEEGAHALTHLRAAATVQATQEPYWWGRASVYDGRVRALRAAIAALPAVTAGNTRQADGAETFRQRTRLLLRENAMAELKLGRSDEAIAQLRRALEVHANDPVAHYYLGRAYAAKASDADELRLAAAAYTTATTVDAAFADAYRELAVTYTKLGDTDRAAEARQSYLALHSELSFFPVSTLNGLANPALLLRSSGTTAPHP